MNQMNEYRVIITGLIPELQMNALITWMQRGHMLPQPVVSEHVQQCGFSCIIQTEKHQLARLPVQP